MFRRGAFPFIAYSEMCCWISAGQGMVFDLSSSKSPGRWSRIRHRNALNERAWKDAVQRQGKLCPRNLV